MNTLRALAGRALPVARRLLQTLRRSRVALLAMQIAIIAVLAVPITRNWRVIRATQWTLTPALALTLLAGYGVIMLLWFAVWLGLTRLLLPIAPRRETRTFAYTLLARHIPLAGAAWNYLGRPAFYAGQGVPAGRTARVIAIDLASQIAAVAALALLMAVGTQTGPLAEPRFRALAGLGGLLACAIAAAALGLPALRRRIAGGPASNAPDQPPIARALLGATAVYALSWVVFAAMTWLFFNGSSNAFPLSPEGALGLCALTGIVSYLTALIPLPTSGLRELSFAWLAALFLGAPAALAPAAAFILAINLCDLALAGVLILISRRAQSAAASAE